MSATLLWCSFLEYLHWRDTRLVHRHVSADELREAAENRNCLLRASLIEANESYVAIELRNDLVGFPPVIPHDRQILLAPIAGLPEEQRERLARGESPWKRVMPMAERD